MKKKYIILPFIILALCIIICRIIYVTKNARTPVVNKISQGESVVYKGVEYSVLDATLWEYNDFFKHYEDVADYASDIEDDTIMILLVELKASINAEENVLDLEIPIEYLNIFNGVDVFMADALNPSLSEGTFKSGDSIYIPYEIYKENLTTEQWEQVVNREITYDLSLGTYPEKNKLMIETVISGGE